MNETIPYDDFADALREQGIEPSTAVVLQNPANFWENLPDGARQGVVDELGLDADPDAVRPTVDEADEGEDDDPPALTFVEADAAGDSPGLDPMEGGPEGPAPGEPGADEPGFEPGTADEGFGAGPDAAGEPDEVDMPGPLEGGDEPGPGPRGEGPGGPDDPLGADGEPGPEADGEGPGGPLDGIGPAPGAEETGKDLDDVGGPGGPGSEGVGPGAGEPGSPADGIEPGPGADELTSPTDGIEPGPGPEEPTSPAEGGEPGPGTGEPTSPVEPGPGPDEQEGPPGTDDLGGEPGPDPAELPEAGEPADEAAPVPDPDAAEEAEAATQELVEPEVEAPPPESQEEEPGVQAVAVHEELDEFPAPAEEAEDEEDEEEGLIDETEDILRRIHGPGGQDATEDPDTDRDLVTFEPPSDPRLDVVERYPVNAPYAYIRILYDNEEQQYWYEAREPALTEHEETVLEFIEETIVDIIEVGLSELTEGEAEEIIEDHFDQIVYDYSISLTERSHQKLLYYLKRDFLGYAKIDVLMQDDKIEDISCDGPGISIFLYHREYESIKSTIRWDEEERLDSFVIRLAQRSGEHISVAEPLLDATLPDGSRLNASLSDEVTSKGSTFTIRKFRDDPFTPTDLVRYGTMDVTMMAFWWFVVQHGASAIYAGGTASGKTTSMNAINLFIPPQMKIVSIEDTREVSLPHENWIPAFTRSGFGSDGDGGQKGEIDMFQLLKAALRQRPEYIMVGEVRGEEAYALFQAMATGHTAYGTMHADSPSSVIHRLESDPISVPRSLLEALDIISIQIQTRIGEKRVRRTKQLVEIVGLDPHTREILTNEVFEWDPSNDEFEFSGVSYVLERLQMELNMTDEELDKELERRKAVIRWLLQEDINDLDEVGRVVATYYKDRDTLMEQVWDDLGEEPGVGAGAGLAGSDPGFAGDEFDAGEDLDTDLELGAEAGDQDIDLGGTDPGEGPAPDFEAGVEPEVEGGGNGHEPSPDLVAMAEAAREADEPLYGGPPPAGTDVDADLGPMAEAVREADGPPFATEDHPWHRSRWPPTPGLEPDLQAMAEGTGPDLHFLPEDHPVRSARTPDDPDPRPGEIGGPTLAGKPDRPREAQDVGEVPDDRREPGDAEASYAGPGELDVPAVPDELRPGTEGDREPGEAREPSPRSVPEDRSTVPEPGEGDGADLDGIPGGLHAATGTPDEAGAGEAPDHPEDPGPADGPGDPEADAAPSVAEALGLEADEARRLREAGFPSVESLREASEDELAEAGLEPETLEAVIDALGDDGPPDPGPDDPGPPPGFDARGGADETEEGRDGA